MHCENAGGDSRLTRHAQLSVKYCTEVMEGKRTVILALGFSAPIFAFDVLSYDR